MKKFSDITYCGEQKLDVYIPDGECSRTFLYFHGGGLEAGDKAGAEKFAIDLTERGIAVVSANYRMYPTAKFPGFIEDAAAAVKWVNTHAPGYGGSDRLFVGGSSAGGYLSMMLCFAPEYLKAAGVPLSEIAGFIHDAGQPTTHFNVLRERGIDTKRLIVDEAAPLYHVGTGEAKYPPMLVIVSDNDMPGRYEQTMLLMATLKHFGCDEGCELKVARGKHCAYVKKQDDSGNSVFAEMIIPFLTRN